MSNLLIMRPTPIASVQSYSNYSGSGDPSNVLTPDPKEAFATGSIPSGGTSSIVFDMGAVVSVDTFFAGFSGFRDEAGFQIFYRTNLGDAETAYNYMVGQPAAIPIRHYVMTGAVATGRYFRFAFTPNFGAPYSTMVGVCRIGTSFRPTWNYELGAGRIVGDTGTADRLQGGGFAIDPGATYGGFQWTLGDLSTAETNALYALARQVGNSRSLLVVEDPDNTVGVNERTHWGILQKLDAYERVDPANTKWSMRIEDWV